MLDTEQTNQLETLRTVWLLTTALPWHWQCHWQIWWCLALKHQLVIFLSAGCVTLSQMTPKWWHIPDGRCLPGDNALVSLHFTVYTSHLGRTLY